MRFAVREQPIQNHPENWKDKDNKAPQKLVRRGAARLEDLDCGATVVSVIYHQQGYKWRVSHILQTIISRTNTMKPMMPPPVPYCHGLAAVALTPSVTVGAASASVASHSWRKGTMVLENIFAVTVSLGFLSVRNWCWQNFGKGGETGSYKPQDLLVCEQQGTRPKWHHRETSKVVWEVRHKQARRKSFIPNKVSQLIRTDT